MTKTGSPHPHIRIHGTFDFDRGAKSRWLLTEIGIPFDKQKVNFEAKENESAEFLKLNPMGRIPVLQVNDRPMFESGAMCAYLADLNIASGIAPALDSSDRAEYQQWLYFAAATLDVFQTRMMIIEDIPAGEIQTAKMNALLEEYRDALGTLDRTLSHRSFLVGNRFTAADICVGYHLYWLPLWPEFEGIFNEFPRVKDYLARLQKMPSAIASKVFSYEA